MKNTALITGASSGIGKEMARLHASRGGDLVLVARRADKLNVLKEELESRHGAKVLVLAEDLNDEAAPQRIFDRVTAENIDLSILINNAGFGHRGKFHELDWEDNRSMIQVNVVALAALTRLFLPGFVARNTGRILNVASTAALTPGPLQATYFATKAFVMYLGNAIAEEISDTSVTVTTLLPGATASEFAKTAGMDKTSLFNRTTPAADVALTGYEAMLRGDLNVFAGVTRKRKIMMWIAPLLPRRYVLKSVREMQEAQPA